MFGSFLFAFTLIYHSTFRMNRKIPIGAEEILLRDKKFYLAVEFSLLREDDFYALTQIPEMPSGRQRWPHDTTFERVKEEYAPFRNIYFRTFH